MSPADTADARLGISSSSARVGPSVVRVFSQCSRKWARRCRQETPQKASRPGTTATRFGSGKPPTPTAFTPLRPTDARLRYLGAASTHLPQIRLPQRQVCVALLRQDDSRADARRKFEGTGGDGRGRAKPLSAGERRIITKS